MALGQNCDVDFPGTANRNYTTSCGGPSTSNLTLGKDVNMNNGDVFTFNSPIVNIDGNLEVNAQGSGKIIIPAGVAVNIDGNFQLKSRNGGCTAANPCFFEIVVFGTLNISGNFQNNLVRLIWSGNGTVVADKHFDNSSNGCMNCGIFGCPDFQMDPSDCRDDGSACGGGDFCAQISGCSTDTTDPIISGCPANITVELTGPGCTQLVDWLPPTATDNCTLLSLTPSRGPNTAFPKGTTTVTYTAKDLRGNTEVCTFTVTVVDKMPPVLTKCTEDITFVANASCRAVATWSPPTFTDNCGVANITPSIPSGSIFNKGTTTVVYTARDAAGNTATCSFKVTVVDNTAPVINGCPANITVNADASCEAEADWVPPIAVDNCSAVKTESNHQPRSKFPIGTTTVTYKFSNSDGASSICTFTVTVRDVTPPLISGPSNIVASTENACNAKVNFAPPTVQDCSSWVIVSSHDPGDEFPIGVTEVSYSATDLAGNSKTFKFNVTVEDKTSPIFEHCPNDIVVNINSGCSAIVNWLKPSATDNCGNANVTSTHDPGTTFQAGTTEVVSTAVDVYGNTSICSFNVIVKYELLPVIENCPGDIYLEGDEQNSAKAEWIMPTATVQCGEVNIKGSHLPGDVFPIGSTTVEYQATDDSGNIAYCRFKVVVSPIEIKIAKAITPNGDGQSDFWELGNIEKFKDNKVVVVDRWGGTVFISTGYDNESKVWRGTNLAGEPVPTGTYFYTISVRASDRHFTKSGPIELVR